MGKETDLFRGRTGGDEMITPAIPESLVGTICPAKTRDAPYPPEEGYVVSYEKSRYSCSAERLIRGRLGRSPKRARSLTPRTSGRNRPQRLSCGLTPSSLWRVGPHPELVHGPCTDTCLPQDGL